MPEQQDAPYDPYIPSGQSAPQQDGAGGNARTQALQAVSYAMRLDGALEPSLSLLLSFLASPLPFPATIWMSCVVLRRGCRGFP
jgi:hypothetical protein